MVEDSGWRFIEGDCDVGSGEALARGWCHKHGNKSRLLCPKRGKAALWAEVQGQGKEVHRGRNVFKRCARTETWCLYVKCRRKVQRSHGAALRKSGKDTVHLHYNKSGKGNTVFSKVLSYDELIDRKMDLRFDLDFDTKEEGEDERADETVTVWHLSKLSEDDFASTARKHGDDSNSTVSELPESSFPQCSSSGNVAVVDEYSCGPRLFIRWEEAALRAELAALAYAVGVGKTRVAPNGPQRFPKTKKRKPECCRHVDFCAIQAEFLRQHGSVVLAALRSCFQEPIELRHAPLSAEVRMRFEMAFAANRCFSRLVPAFHGTNSKLHESIFEQGLLIPGRGNSLRVLHGSAHGLGIYTATVNNPCLSAGFCSAPRMLVCGVIDDTTRDHGSYYMGSHTVSRESEMIRHVGCAMVVFDPCRVAPLFEAVGSGLIRGKADTATTPTSRAIAAKKAKEARKRELLTRLMSESPAAVYIMRRAAQSRRGY